MRKLFLLAFVAVAAGLWADDSGVVEPANADEALVILSMRFDRFMSLDPGPDVVRLLTIDPWISGSYPMGKDGAMFYMGNLKVGRTYRIDSVGALLNRNEYFSGYFGLQGNDGLSFTVEGPGIIYLGDFQTAKDKPWEFLGKKSERALLQKLLGNLAFRPTWKKLVEQRIKELK